MKSIRVFPSLSFTQVTPKPRRKARFIYQKKKKEKHVTFCVDPDGKLAVQKFYVEKFPPINGLLRSADSECPECEQPTLFMGPCVHQK
ncbi:hypothetical protein CRM22_002243 [Opisthorchis felineus]|uniref:Uncharacterized protein n=1 Tax=Opisthorchis felineus TaxID=147828 RepID=A0A4S2MCY6_OPIFE|nr:hypothetical protein CRM22_002243 [Opisthorchis felineus]